MSLKIITKEEYELNELKELQQYTDKLIELKDSIRNLDLFSEELRKHRLGFILKVYKAVENILYWTYNPILEKKISLEKIQRNISILKLYSEKLIDKDDIINILELDYGWEFDSINTYLDSLLAIKYLTKVNPSLNLNTILSSSIKWILPKSYKEKKINLSNESNGIFDINSKKIKLKSDIKVKK